MTLKKILLVSLVVAGLSACAVVASQPGYRYAVAADQVYAEPAGESLGADIYMPEGAGPFPAVMVIHGGGWVGGERADMDAVSRQLAREGFVAMNISYRSARQYPYPAQVEDCRAAVRWLRANAARFNTDPQRIGVLGYSAGGHLALMLGVTDAPKVNGISAEVAAVVSGAGPTDLRKYPDSGLVKRFLGGRMPGREDIYADASPITHVSGDDPPVFFYHGRHDMVVEIEQSLDMAAALHAAGVETVVDEQPFGHTLTFIFDDASLARAADFLRAQLGS